MMGVSTDTVVNWEKDKTEPVAALFRSVVAFLGYDPTPEAQTLADRLEAKQRSLGASLAQVARHLGWDPGSLRRYLDGTWRISPDRRGALEVFLNTDDAALAGHGLRASRRGLPCSRLWHSPRNCFRLTTNPTRKNTGKIRAPTLFRRPTRGTAARPSMGGLANVQ